MKTLDLDTRMALALTGLYERVTIEEYDTIMASNEYNKARLGFNFFPLDYEVYRQRQMAH